MSKGGKLSESRERGLKEGRHRQHSAGRVFREILGRTRTPAGPAGLTPLSWRGCSPSPGVRVHAKQSAEVGRRMPHSHPGSYELTGAPHQLTLFGPQLRFALVVGPFGSDTESPFRAKSPNLHPRILGDDRDL